MLIDTRVWFVIANFRETQLHRIQIEMHANVYVLSRPGIKYDGWSTAGASVCAQLGSHRNIHPPAYLTYSVP
jgi:multidrug resistance efflux pump